MNVTLLSTGGTIASTADGGRGASPDLDAQALSDAVPDVDRVDELDVETFTTVPSNRMTIDRMWELTERVRELEGDTDAVVVTHGTDTLAESAYFLDLCYGGDLPVAFTGAMRPASDPGPDGPANLEATLRAVVSDGAPGDAVLVSLADRLFAARDAIKSHTTAADAFESREFGPLGVADAEGVTWRRRRTSSETYDPDPVALTNDVLAVTVTADLPARQLRPAVDSDALCLATLGAGHVPPALVSVLEDVRAEGVPIVATSRCREGRLADDTYDFPGSERALHHLDCLVTDLDLPKARIKTVVGSAAGRLNEAFVRY